MSHKTTSLEPRAMTSGILRTGVFQTKRPQRGQAGAEVSGRKVPVGAGTIPTSFRNPPRAIKFCFRVACFEPSVREDDPSLGRRSFS
jgi:hypothetical protein